ncbi:MAG: ChuX/HutX family heme-like substrate-binding protein [Candidatus Nitrosopolaris sp.]
MKKKIIHSLMKIPCCSMELDTKYDLSHKLISDIPCQQDILLSVNSGSGIAEVRVEKGLPFRIRDKWATIGDEDRPWHIHLNMDEIAEARFVKEPRPHDGRQSYSISFFDSRGDLSMRANFTKLYDSNGNLINEKVAKFDEMYVKYGSKEVLSLRV